ncbi:MAG: hypothetical protein ACT4OK_21760 [Gemmobacter sp.]
MDLTWIVLVLSLGTLIAVAVIASYAKTRIDARRANPRAPKSSLAKDGPEGGLPQE